MDLFVCFCFVFALFLFFAIATIFQLYLGSDMMYDMGRRKPKSTLLPTQRNFNLPHHIGIVREELAFDDTQSYTYQRSGTGDDGGGDGDNNSVLCKLYIDF